MNEQFKPYVPAEKVTPEFTVTSVIMGVLLAIIFGAANAYLGLRVGMTVSASIPAAVISMGVIRVIMRKDSILESNMVQTIGSAGESLAAGAIFTMPVLFLWAKDGVIEQPSMLTISLIALCGGVLGVLFMVPLRNALIVRYSVCRGSLGRGRRWSQCNYGICRYGICSAFQIPCRWIKSDSWCAHSQDLSIKD